MLARKNRIGGGVAFKKVLKEGKLYALASFGALVRPKGETEPVRIGFIVSGKVSKKAVERNRIKRRLSGLIRKHGLERATGADIVFLPKKVILARDEADLAKEVLNLKTRIFKNAG